jgi:hypothetical protein
MPFAIYEWLARRINAILHQFSTQWHLLVSYLEGGAPIGEVRVTFGVIDNRPQSNQICFDIQCVIEFQLRYLGFKDTFDRGSIF